jgi:hypothetical protein
MNSSAAGTTDTWTHRLIAPHAWLGRSAMTALTGAMVLLGLALSRLGVRFDGFLDLHRAPGGAPVPLSAALADQFVSLPLSALVAWLVLRGFGAHPRWSTLLLVIGIMRVPLVLTAPVVLAAPDQAVLAQGPIEPTPAMLGVGLVVVLGFAWTVTLLVTGVRFATELRGARLAWAVVCVIVGAEIVSKVVLWLLS